jgi:hypothetical protein
MVNVESLRSTASDVVRRVPTKDWSYPSSSAVNGSSPTVWADMPLARWRGLPRRRYHSCSWPLCPRRSDGSRWWHGSTNASVSYPAASRGSPSRSDIGGHNQRVPPRGGLPVWRYTFDSIVLEKRLFMPNELNSILVTYTLLQGPDGIRLGLRPMLGVRMHEAPVNRTVPQEPVVSAHDRWLDVTVGEGVPTIRLAVRDHQATFYR